MKIAKFFSGLFALLGAAIGVGTVLLCLQSLDQEPRLLEAPAAASAKVEAMLDAVCRDDYTAAASLMYGTPELGAHLEEEDTVSALIWDAFVDSIGYELTGECYATDNGIAQDIRLSYLDIASVTDSLQSRSRALLQQRISEAEDMEEVYDENNEYRQDFVENVVIDAAKAALSEDAGYVETTLTVDLIFSRGQWWILADDTLMQAISGGMVQ